MGSESSKVYREPEGKTGVTVQVAESSGRRRKGDGQRPGGKESRRTDQSGKRRAPTSQRAPSQRAGNQRAGNLDVPASQRAKVPAAQRAKAAVDGRRVVSGQCDVKCEAPCVSVAHACVLCVRGQQHELLSTLA
jgi:hypothetical protein